MASIDNRVALLYRTFLFKILENVKECNRLKNPELHIYWNILEENDTY